MSFVLLSIGWIGLKIAKNIESNSLIVIDEVTPSIQVVSSLQAAVLQSLESYGTILFYKQIDPKETNSSESIKNELVEFESANNEILKRVEEYKRIVNRSPFDYPYYEEIYQIVLKLNQELSKFSFEQVSLSKEDHIIDKDNLDKMERRLSALTNLAIETEVQNLRSIQLSTKNSIEKGTSLALSTLVIAFFVATILGLVLAYHISAPIIKISKEMQQTNTNSQTILSLQDRRDEIGSLAKSFTQMMQRLDNTTVSRELVDSIINSLSDAVVVLDRSMHVNWMNMQAQVLLGQNSTTNLTFDKIFPNQQLELENIFSANFTNEKPLSFETKITRVNGEEIIASVTITTLASRNSSPSYVCVIRNLTEIKLKEREITSYRERLNQSERLASIGGLAAKISHRLNQPLSAIRLFIQQTIRTIKNNPSDPGVIECLTDSLSQIDRAQLIVQEILKSTRAPKSKPKKEINIQSIAEKTIALFRAQTNPLPLEISLSNLSSLPNILCVEEEIEEVFFVLIQNAIQAVTTERNCYLKIIGSLGKDSITIEFIDNCKGIEAEDLNSIFAPFHTTKEIGVGTGLGLHIIKELIEKNGGSVKVNSEWNNGSTFTVVIPIIFNFTGSIN
jgi:PAS domain S-box-containing protein